MKHKIIVLSDWTYPLENSWSGTTYSLTQALSRYYDVEIKNLAIGKWLNRCEKLAGLPFVGSAFGRLHDYCLKLKANKVIGENKEIPVFEICQDIKVKNPYFTYQDMTYHAGLLVKRLKVKFPFIYQAAGNDFFSEDEIHRREKRQYDEYLNAQAAFFMSKWVEKIMSDFHKDIAPKFIHIGGGTNIDINKIDISKKVGNKFLFIGRDFERKAGDLVIKAFRILKEKYMPNAELHMAGCAPQDKIDGIYYYGDVDYKKVGELLNSCDVFCMPSRFEAYGLVFVEALIFGLPCIGRKFFEMPHFIKEGEEGALIENDNPQVLAQTMFDVISDKEMIANIQSKQLDYINRYSWNSVAERAKKVIDAKLNWN